VAGAFHNTQLECSQPDLAEFYARVTVAKGIVTSMVNGVQIEFDAQTLGDILGVPAAGFDLYVRKDRSLLGKAKLLDLGQRLSQQPELKHPQTVKKGDITPLHQLLFWYVIKNIIPCGQGRNQADAMDQCFTDLMDKGEQINVSAIMIKHIARIANTTRAHDLRYGFLLTRVFEHFGVELQKRMEAQVIDEVGSSTLIGCGFELVQEEDPGDEQGLQTPAPPVPSSSLSQPSVEVLQQEQQRLQAELTTVKGVLPEEKELSAKRHEDLLVVLAALTAKLSPPAP